MTILKRYTLDGLDCECCDLVPEEFGYWVSYEEAAKRIEEARNKALDEARSEMRMLTYRFDSFHRMEAAFEKLKSKPIPEEVKQ